MILDSVADPFTADVPVGGVARGIEAEGRKLVARAVSALAGPVTVPTPASKWAITWLIAAESAGPRATYAR